MRACTGYPESMQFQQLQLSIFVKPICLSIFSVTKQAQCKTVLTISVGNKIPCFGTKRKDQEAQKSSHN